MISYPSDLMHSLEFDKVVELIRDGCLCSANKAKSEILPLFRNKEDLENAFSELSEVHQLIESGNGLHIHDFDDIEPSFTLLLKKDYVLDLEQILSIKDVVFQIHELKKQVTDDFKEEYPLLSEMIDSLYVDIILINSFNAIFDEDNSVKNNASPELAIIHKKIRSKELELDKQFNSLLNNYKSKAWLAETGESFKNGRRVLSVNAENKRKIKGIIHDESATGKTVFIEPEQIIEINNDLFDLINERKKELYKIFRTLCNTLGGYVSDLKAYSSLLLKLDFLNSKARFGALIEGVRPKIKSKSQIQLNDAFHPLLYLKNKEIEKPTIPFDLALDKHKVLLISGPNAGGKSVTLKTVGLIQLMFQSALFVSARSAELGVFEKIFGDIGDHQSLEDDLSTYSSRLQYMNHFLSHSDEKTLILIDEFGSGTDPKIGGAIAEAILQALLKRDCYGVITTHYSNLKIFAYKNKGIVNAAMIFDEEGMKPTYHMRVGRPGSSFAFEIANKIGLPKPVIQSAKSRISDPVRAADQLLVDLQKEKRDFENRNKDLENQKSDLDKLIKNYELLHQELEVRRKKLKLDMKEVALKATSDKKKELEKYIKDLASKKAESKARQESKKMKEEISTLQQESAQIKQELFYSEKIDLSDLKEGSFVKLRGSETIGKIISISKKKVELQVGAMTMFVPLEELRPSKEIIEAQHKKSINLTLGSQSKVHAKLDIRGFRKSDAIAIVEDFIDKALVNNLSQLEIIHGKGNGVLREIVKNKLKEYNDIKKMWHPEENHGGEGVTLVEL